MAQSMASLPPRPHFDDLPLRKDGPRGNIWGHFGDDDEIGLLNYITPATVKAASQDIRLGVRVALDLSLQYFSKPFYHRPALEHKIIQSGDYAAHDDEIKINTQSSTQWDGLRHCGYQDARLFYNGTTLEQIGNSSKLGIHKLVEAGGFAARGVLLDVPRWLSRNNHPKKDSFATTTITVDELRQTLAFQGVDLRPSDILMIRTGFLADLPSLSAEASEERLAMAMPPSIGLEQSKEMLRFLWESGVVAVASDCPALEAWPPPGDGEGRGYWLHEWLLAGWGCPIGELFDLEKLAVECETAGKWSFFFTSVPLNVKGGVASTVCGMAIL